MDDSRLVLYVLTTRMTSRMVEKMKYQMVMCMVEDTGRQFVEWLVHLAFATNILRGYCMGDIQQKGGCRCRSWCWCLTVTKSWMIVGRHH